MQPKLRTVLWGWAGEEIPDAELARLDALLAALDDPAPGALAAELGTLITRAEVEALRARTARAPAHPPAPRAAARLARHPVAGAVGAAP